jgi:hypothetical protein
MTLVEVMVAMGIFGLVVVGLLSAQMFGMHYDALTCSKLGASENSRLGFDSLTHDIRASKIWRIGNGDQSGFTGLGNAVLQQGNALQLSLTTDTNSYVRYYFDTNQAQLCRLVSGVSSIKVIAKNLTNAMYFHAENYLGASAHDLQYKYVIVTTLEFALYRYPLTHVGPGYYYDYYRVQFKVAPHCPDGA